NPASGWLYNSNNWPWSAAGPNSPKQQDYPPYVETGGESARGLHAIRVLEHTTDFTLTSLIGAAFDSYLTWFERPIRALIKAWDETPAADPLKAKLSEQIALLRAWDLRWSATSFSRSATRGRAFRCRSRPPGGARWPRSRRARTPEPRGGTGRAATASWPSWSSATACGRRRSPPAGRAAIPTRRTSTMKRDA